MNSIKRMLAKLKRPYWTPLPTQSYITDWQGQIAHYNLYYVLQGRPSRQVAGDLKRNKNVLIYAISIANSSSPSSRVADSIMVMSPEEFYKHEVATYPKFYSRFLALAEWHRVLHDKSCDHAPVQVPITTRKVR